MQHTLDKWVKMFFVNLVNWVFTQTHRWRYSDVDIKLSRLQVLLPSQWVTDCEDSVDPPDLIWARSCSLGLVFHRGQAVITNTKLSMCVSALCESAAVSFSIRAYVHSFTTCSELLLISSLRPCFLFILEYMQLHLSLSFLSPDNNFFRRVSFYPPSVNLLFQGEILI